METSSQPIQNSETEREQVEGEGEEGEGEKGEGEVEEEEDLVAVESRRSEKLPLESPIMLRYRIKGLMQTKRKRS